MRRRDWHRITHLVGRPSHEKCHLKLKVHQLAGTENRRLGIIGSGLTVGTANGSLGHDHCARSVKKIPQELQLLKVRIDAK